MSNYDFNRLLDPNTFEYFAKDIIEIRENLEFEIFGEGADQGIDLRNESENGTIIVQVKRFGNFNSLYTHLKNVEYNKVKKLNPDRYIMITSVSLTVARKQKIKELFKEYIKHTDDIIGHEELNSLLDKPKYKSVEDTYYQLWINSTNVLRNIIRKEVNHDIYVQSKYELECIRESSKIYVKNDNFKDAINQIEKNRCLLICGEPEVGKSTLARNLCAYLLNKNRDAEFICTEHIKDLLRVYDDEKSQIFFIDDFWGIKFDDNLKGNQENTLKKIIQMIQKSNNKVLLLTSREYILEQGYAEYPEIEEFFDTYKFKLTIKDYSDLFKARVLFKHLQNSQLDWFAVYQIVQGYASIIRNDNYSPRIIENYINYVSNREIEVDDYLRDFIDYLEQPHKIWEAVFSKQNEGAQLITILMLLFDEPIQLETIKGLFFTCLDYNLKINARKKDFMKYIAQLENTLITTYKDLYYSRDDIFIKFKNSSIQLYIYKYFCENSEEYAKTIIMSTTYLNNLMYLSGSWEISRNTSGSKYENININLKISKELQETIVDRIMKDFDKLCFKDEGDYFVTYQEGGSQISDKLLVIMNLYERDRNQTLKLFIEEKIKEVMKNLETNLGVNYEDMFALPHLIARSKELHIYANFEPYKILDSFWNAIRFSRQILILEDFKEVFPEEYDKFVEKINIKERIINLTLDDADFFMSDGMYNCIDELREFTIPELFERYHIEYTKWYFDDFYNITDEVLFADKKRMKKIKRKIDYSYKEDEQQKVRIKNREKEIEIIEQEKNKLLNNYNNNLKDDEDGINSFLS